MNLHAEEILHNTSDSILSFDRDLNIISFNPAAERLFGYSIDEVMGQPLDILLPSSVRKIHGSFVDEFRQSSDIARQMANRMQVRGVTKDGQEKNLDISILKHPREEMARFTAVCRDVSERAAISRALEQSEARLSRAQAIAHLGNWE